MRLLALISALALSASALAASPRFVTPEMTFRNGLTDEQYELLWSMGRRPSIDPATARDWIFRSARYGNVTNWLNICGRTNNFAKLSYVLQDANFELADTNRVLVSSNETLRVSLAAAEADAKALKDLEKAARKFGKNLAKVRKDFEKYRDKAKVEEEAAFWQSLLDALPVPNEEES